MLRNNALGPLAYIMNLLFAPTSRLVRARSHLARISIALFLLATSACAEMTNPPVPTATVTTHLKQDDVTTARKEGQPLEAMLPKLHPELQSFVSNFAATVPDKTRLPEMAYVSVVFVDPTSWGQPAQSGGAQIVKQSNGYLDTQLVIGNVGWNTNQPNVICLRNGSQTGCTPEAEVWQVDLPAQTMAFLPVHFKASPGDQLTFLFLAHNELERGEPASQSVEVYVDYQPTELPGFVDAPPQAKVLGGCDNVALTTHNTFRSTFRPPRIQKRGDPLYVLVQLCRPTGQEYVWLVPIVNRTTVPDIQGEVWHSLVKLPTMNESAAVVPVDTSKEGSLGSARSFQVAVIPFRSAGTPPIFVERFTDEARFQD